MKPLDRLSGYLTALERRLRLLAVARGVAACAAAALVLTVLAVLAANHFSFSGPSVAGARVFLFLGLALAVAAALIVPLIRLNRRRAARTAEHRYPQFEERLLTFTERLEHNDQDPFLQLLAADTLHLAEQAQPRQVARTAWIFSFSSAAVVSALVLIWLAASGPGFLGYGASLLWGGLPKGSMKPFYAIQVDPGNRTIRKRADQVISATLMGFSSPKVRLFAKYGGASAWEQTEMSPRPGGAAYQFLIAGVPESLEYYVEAGGVRSDTYGLKVVDLPAVKSIRVTYHFPAWIGIGDAVEDPGGDLRAVTGTTAAVVVRTDRPLSNGAILLDDGTKLALKPGPDGTAMATVAIEKDGMYHVAALEGGEDVRLGEDYFIEAQKDQPPEVTITRPGRDFKASPIEEVTVAVNAKDDFGLKAVELHYSVNGGAEKTLPLLNSKDGKTSSGTATLALEDFKVVPGDVVSVYATAKDARQSSSTDMFFIEAQPFEKNYTQSQQMGGGAGGDDQGDPQSQISERQKEIVTATFNQLKGNGAKGTDAENAAFLASVQSKLRDQTKSLGDRMRARQLEDAGDSFKSFVTDMDKAVAAMGPAADNLRGRKWQGALAPEQQALQYLLRAEATFRDIQVAFGQRGGGGGGGMNSASRDMEGLFDLELDTEKNQYETGASGSEAADQRQKQIDEALEKLRQLAKRQQELAEQQRQNPQQTSEQRWQQEMLRREAEQLQQQMQQLAQNQGSQLSRNGQQGQQQQGQQGQQGQSGQQGMQAGQSGQSGQQQQGNNSPTRGADSQQLRQTIDRLQQALEDMRQSADSRTAGTPQGEAGAKRAADRLQEAEQMLNGLRSRESSNEVSDLAQQAGELARKQQEFEGQMRRSFGPLKTGVTRQQAEQLAGQKDSELSDLKRLEQQMQNSVRNLMSNNRPASTKMREALAGVQQQDLERAMQRNSGWIRNGMGEYAAMSETQITAALNDLSDQLDKLRQSVGQGQQSKAGQDGQPVEDALNRVEQLHRQMEQLQASAAGQRGQQGQPGQPSQSGQGGQQGQAAQQGQQGQSSQSGQGGQQGGGQQGSPGKGGGQWQAAGAQGGAWGGAGGANWIGNGVRGRYNDGPIRPEDVEASARRAEASLQQLQQQLKDDPNMQRDIQGLIRDLRQFDPAAYTNDPLLAQRIQAAMESVEQVEIELRRKLDQSGGGAVRSPGSETVPQGYSDAVADYFRKLSKQK